MKSILARFLQQLSLRVDIYCVLQVDAYSMKQAEAYKVRSADPAMLISQHSSKCSGTVE